MKKIIESNFSENGVAIVTEKWAKPEIAPAQYIESAELQKIQIFKKNESPIFLFYLFKIKKFIFLFFLSLR